MKVHIFFYKNTRLIFLKILEKIKNNPASAEEQSLKFSVKVVNKTATSDAQFVKVHFALRLFTYNC